MNLTELIDASAQRLPTQPALIDGETVVSYERLVQWTRDLAAQLQALGIKPGDRIGLSYPNGALYIALTFALWRVNAVAVPIPTECAAEEVSDMILALGLAGMISQQRRPHAVELPNAGFFENFTTPPTDNHNLNMAFIRFTSGTTCARKGVVVCHETVRDRIDAANKALQIGPADTIVWCLPMAHHFLITIVLYLSRGATVALVHNTLARSILETTKRVQGTVLYAAPMHFAWLARDRSELDLATVRLAVSTTCALTRDVAEDFSKRFQRPLIQALGIIELGLVCLNLDDPVGRWNSVGKPLPDFHVRLSNVDSDGAGELEVSGPGIFDGYLQPWTPRSATMPDGWFHTGDIARIDDAGFVYLLSRQTAVINMAGRKVFPEEIETVLNRHPAVKESRVYGRAQQQLGEIIEAEVVLFDPTLDPEELRDYCRSHLAAFKIPTSIHPVQSVARTAATGKIRRLTASPVND